MDPTQCLREEHQLILNVLDCFEIALRQAREAGHISRDKFGPFIEFFQGFADQCHHCKEEDRLFPALERAGVPRQGGPIGVMLYEHKQARLHVRTMAELLDEADVDDTIATQEIFEQARNYLNLLRAHINKEDHCLYGMANQLISGTELTALTTSYSEAEAEESYCQKNAHCRDIAHRLMEEYGTVAH